MDLEALVRAWRRGDIRTSALTLHEAEQVHVRVMELAVTEHRARRGEAIAEAGDAPAWVDPRVVLVVKTCRHCPERGAQPVDAFYRDGSRADGRDSWCIACRTAYVRAARERQRFRAAS